MRIFELYHEQELDMIISALDYYMESGLAPEDYRLSTLIERAREAAGEAE